MSVILWKYWQLEYTSYSYLLIAGLENFIKEIGTAVPEEIETQLRLYDNLKNDDLDELSSKWNRVQSDFSDVSSAFQVQNYLYYS